MRGCNTLLVAAVAVLCSLTAKAQDPSFSQFYAHRVYLNPALAGLDGGLSVSAISRLQWLRADRGFKTYGFALEFQEPFLRSGFALNLLHNTEGVGNLGTTTVGLAYAYTIPGRRNNLHLGVQTRWVQKSVDWDQFIFSDQLDPVLGPIYPTTAMPGLERTSYFDVDFGVVWRFDSGLSLGRGSVRESRSMVGLSLHHLPALFSSPQIDESFQYLTTPVPPRLTLHLGTIIPVTFLKGSGNKIAFSPNFKFDIQGERLFNFGESLKVFTLGAYTLYEGFSLGIFYQDQLPLPSGIKNTNAVIVTVGGYIPTGNQRNGDGQKLYLGFSVDINTTGLGAAGGNVYELALRYNFADVPGLFGRSSSRKRSAERMLDCKDFF